MDEKGKIHLEEADLITYYHGEYFKMDTEALGKFGYSVAKKPIHKKEVKAKLDDTKVKEVKQSSILKKNSKKKSVKNNKNNKNKGKKNFITTKNTKKLKNKVK